MTAVRRRRATRDARSVLTGALSVALSTAMIVAACGSPSPDPTSSPQASAASETTAPSASAGDPGPTTTPEPTAVPSITAQPSQAVVRGPGAREVFAFVNWWSLPDVDGRLEFDTLSTIAFFSLHVDPDGDLVIRTKGRPSEEWTAWQGERMTRLIDAAHAAGTRVVLSVTRFGWEPQGDRETRAFLSRAAARKRLAEQVADAVVARGVDGVNVDLEPVPDGHRDDFTSLIREIRAQLDARRPGLELTFCSIGFTTQYDLRALIGPDAADAVFIMAYQYRGPFSPEVGSVAPLGGPEFGVEPTVDAFLRGARRDRIILGIPYYGWEWPAASDDLHAPVLALNDRNGPSRQVYYAEAARLAEEHGGTIFDPHEGSARVVYRSRACPRCPLVWRQLYFDDSRSLARKYAYVNERDLLGAGIWALGFEGPHSRELNRLLREAFPP